MTILKIEKGKNYIAFIPAHKGSTDKEMATLGDNLIRKTGCKIAHVFGLEGLSKVQLYEAEEIEEVKEEIKEEVKEEIKPEEKKKISFL